MKLRFFPLRFGSKSRGTAPRRPGTGAQVVGLVSLMRAESATENLGDLAMLNALSTALFAIALRSSSAKERRKKS